MIAYQIARGLARRGHQVLLVAPKESVPPEGVELHGTTLFESEQQAYSGYWQKLSAFDCIIDHSWMKYAYILKLEGRLNAPVLGVLHAPCDTMYGSPPPMPLPCFVAISKDQAFHASQVWGLPARVAYNGIDPDLYKAIPNIPKNGRYLFLARFSQIKGPHIAVDIARKFRFGLDLVGDDKITCEPELAQRMMALAQGNIKYHGPVPREKCIEFFTAAKALLHMNMTYREPFGMVPIEAQMCGLPVIAFDNGAMRETVKHGETGFIVKTQEEVEELIKTDAVKDIKPEACREFASQFSIQNMVLRYEELCTEAIDRGW
jgi:glycosyltransferase involved in cell wall biosynthesis